MSRREMLKLSSLVFGGALLAGCAPTVTPTQAAPAPTQAAAPAATPTTPAATALPPPEETGPITVWLTTGDTYDCLVKSECDSFNAKSKVKVEPASKADVNESVRAALAAGAGPDIFPTNGASYTLEFAIAGQLLNLDPFIEMFNWKSVFQSWALNTGVYNTHLFGLPAELETIVIWYNKTLFDQKQWPLPTKMDDLLALCKTINDAGVIPFAGQAGECKPCNEWYFIEYCNKIAGPDKFYQALTGKIPWTDDGFVEGITTLNTVVQNGWLEGSPAKFLSATFDEFRSNLGAGKAAMNMEGTWFYSNVFDYFGAKANNTNDWDIIPFPSKTGAEIYDLGLGSSWVVNKAAKAPNACGAWLTNKFSPAVASASFASCKQEPPPIQIKAEDIQGVDPRISKVYGNLSKATTEGRYGYTNWTFFPPKSLVYAYTEIEKVWVGQETPKEYLAGLDKVFQEELKAGKVPPIPTRG